MTELISTLTEWLSQHPELIVTAIGLMAFVESLAMIGIIVPGVALLFATATLAGGLQFELWHCLLSAMAGAVAGDLFSFFLGRYAHGPALRVWPFRQHPLWIERGEQFFRRYGIFSVVIGRFVGPIRPVLPFVAGMLSMPPLQFVVVNLLSALAWAPVYILPGYLVGSSTRSGAQLVDWSQQQIVGSAVSVLTLTGLVLLWLVHRQLRPAPEPGTEESLPGNGFSRWLRQRQLPVTWSLLLLICVPTLLALSLVVTQTGWLEATDRAVSDWLFALRSTSTDQLFIPVTLVGDGLILLILSLISWAWLWLSGRSQAALCWLGGLVAVIAVNQAMKYGLALPRPELLATPPRSWSFPSAHTSNSAFFLFMASGLIARGVRWQRRWWLYGPATIAAVMVAFSRVYLGVHWFSDVVGGLLLAAAVAAASQLVYARLSDGSDSIPLDRRTGGWALCLTIAAALYLMLTLPTAIIFYQPLTGG